MATADPRQFGVAPGILPAVSVTPDASVEVSDPEVALDDRTPKDPGTHHSYVESLGDPHPRRKLIFAIAAIALFMASVDATIVATALPKIEGGLHARLNWAGWTITIYQLGQIIAMPLAGRLSDQFGRKKLFLICIVVFTASSLLCGLSTSIYMLIPLRLIQSLGGGAFMPSASGIVADHFGRDRDRALGMFTSIFPIGGIVGPVFGGVIAEFWTWRGIFFINIPIGIALVILTIRFIPTVAPVSQRSRFDIRGVLLLATTIITGMFVITSLGDKRLDLPGILVAAVVSIGLGYGFMRHTNRSEDPYIPMRLLRGKGFSVMNLLNVMYGSAALGFGVLVPLYAEKRYGIHIANAGLLLSARAIGMISIAAVSAMLLRRTGYRLPMIIGFASIAVGLVMLSIAPRFGISPYLWLAGFSALTGLGMGCSAPATNNATLQLAPDQVAAIAGLRGMFRQTGGILYVSIATAILSRSGDPGFTQAHLFLLQAVVLLMMIGMVYMVPDHKGSW